MGHMLLMSSFANLEEWQLEEGFGSWAGAVRSTIEVVFAWDGRTPVRLIPVECWFYHMRLLGLVTVNEELRLWLTMVFWLVLPVTCMVVFWIIALAIYEVYEAAFAIGSAGGGHLSSLSAADLDGEGEDIGGAHAVIPIALRPVRPRHRSRPMRRSGLPLGAPSTRPTITSTKKRVSPRGSGPMTSARCPSRCRWTSWIASPCL